MKALLELVGLVVLLMCAYSLSILVSMMREQLREERRERQHERR